MDPIWEHTGNRGQRTRDRNQPAAIDHALKRETRLLFMLVVSLATRFREADNGKRMS